MNGNPEHLRKACDGSLRRLKLEQIGLYQLHRIDPKYPAEDQLGTLKDLQAQVPNLPILVLSMHDESLYAERVLRAGAKGYITKQEATKKIMLAIRQVLSGQIYISEKMASRMVHKMVLGRVQEQKSPIERLTDRELEVFQLIGQWKKTREIAEELHLSIKTIEYYREQIKRKLNLKSASELTHYATSWVQREQKTGL